MRPKQRNRSTWVWASAFVALSAAIVALTLLLVVKGKKREEPIHNPGTTVNASNEKTSTARRIRRGSYSVGKDTTSISGPIDANGYIDYAAALNEKLRTGVTPDNNAAVLIWKAIGPRPEKKLVPAEYFRLLEMEPPPEKGAYFVPFRPLVNTDARFEANLRRAECWPWTAEQYPELFQGLSANSAPLDLVIEATRRSGSYWPVLAAPQNKTAMGLLGEGTPALVPSRQLLQALNARAMLRLGEGRMDEAWQDLLACHRLGSLLGRGSTLMEAILGIAIDVATARADLVYFDRAAKDRKRLEACLRDVRALPRMPIMAEKMDLAERFLGLDTLMMLDRHGIDYLPTLQSFYISDKAPRFTLTAELLEGVDWDPALRATNRTIDRYVSAMQEKNRAARRTMFERMDREAQAIYSRVGDGTELLRSVRGSNEPAKARGEAIADILTSLEVGANLTMTTSTSGTQDAQERAGQVRANLSIACALTIYRLDVGRYPGSLNELAPKYLPEVPNDVFTGRPLKYETDHTTCRFYSFGPNELDDGGRGFEDNPAGDDILVQLPPLRC